jgi:hypothetical protein
MEGIMRRRITSRTRRYMLAVYSCRATNMSIFKKLNKRKSKSKTRCLVNYDVVP